MDQRLGYVTAPDGTRICYGVAGTGPLLVKAANWLTHVEYDWESPVWRHWWQLAKGHTLVRYDQRGCGLSDWAAEDLSFDARMTDLETVVDHLGLERFDLLGISHGGPAALEYSVRHPERVGRIVVHGASARGWHKRGLPAEERQAQKVLLNAGWDADNPAYRNILAIRLIPEATREQIGWFDDLQQKAATAENAIRTADASDAIDVVGRLELVSKPTIVTHCTGDGQIAYREGQLIAALVPGARFLSVESNNHLLLETEPAWRMLLSEVRSFLDGGPTQRAVESLGQVLGHTPFGLTGREVEVVRLIAEGKTDKEIADALRISVRTVSHHVNGIFAKTASSNRTEAAVRAVRQGVI